MVLAESKASGQPRLGTDAEAGPVDASLLRPHFSRTIIAAGGFTHESAGLLLHRAPRI